MDPLVAVVGLLLALGLALALLAVAKASRPASEARQRKPPAAGSGSAPSTAQPTTAKPAVRGPRHAGAAAPPRPLNEADMPMGRGAGPRKRHAIAQQQPEAGPGVVHPERAPEPASEPADQLTTAGGRSDARADALLPGALASQQPGSVEAGTADDVPELDTFLLQPPTAPAECPAGHTLAAEDSTAQSQLHHERPAPIGADHSAAVAAACSGGAPEASDSEAGQPAAAPIEGACTVAPATASACGTEAQDGPHEQAPPRAQQLPLAPHREPEEQQPEQEEQQQEQQELQLCNAHQQAPHAQSRARPQLALAGRVDTSQGAAASRRGSGSMDVPSAHSREAHTSEYGSSPSLASASVAPTSCSNAPAPTSTGTIGGGAGAGGGGGAGGPLERISQGLEGIMRRASSLASSSGRKLKKSLSKARMSLKPGNGASLDMPGPSGASEESSWDASTVRSCGNLLLAPGAAAAGEPSTTPRIGSMDGAEARDMLGPLDHGAELDCLSRNSTTAAHAHQHLRMNESGLSKASSGVLRSSGTSCLLGHDSVTSLPLGSKGRAPPSISAASMASYASSATDLSPSTGKGSGKQRGGSVGHSKAKEALLGALGATKTLVNKVAGGAMALQDSPQPAAKPRVMVSTHTRDHETPGERRALFRTNKVSPQPVLYALVHPKPQPAEPKAQPDKAATRADAQHQDAGADGPAPKQGGRGGQSSSGRKQAASAAAAVAAVLRATEAIDQHNQALLQRQEELWQQREAAQQHQQHQQLQQQQQQQQQHGPTRESAAEETAGHPAHLGGTRRAQLLPQPLTYAQHLLQQHHLQQLHLLQQHQQKQAREAAGTESSGAPASDGVPSRSVTDGGDGLHAKPSMSPASSFGASQPAPRRTGSKRCPAAIQVAEAGTPAADFPSPQASPQASSQASPQGVGGVEAGLQPTKALGGDDNALLEHLSEVRTLAPVAAAAAAAAPLHTREADKLPALAHLAQRCSMVGSPLRGNPATGSGACVDQERDEQRTIEAILQVDWSTPAQPGSLLVPASCLTQHQQLALDPYTGCAVSPTRMAFQPMAGASSSSRAPGPPQGVHVPPAACAASAGSCGAGEARAAPLAYRTSPLKPKAMQHMPTTPRQCEPTAMSPMSQQSGFSAAHHLPHQAHGMGPHIPSPTDADLLALAAAFPGLGQLDGDAPLPALTAVEQLQLQQLLLATAAGAAGPVSPSAHQTLLGMQHSSAGSAPSAVPPMPLEGVPGGGYFIQHLPGGAVLLMPTGVGGLPLPSLATMLPAGSPIPFNVNPPLPMALAQQTLLLQQQQQQQQHLYAAGISHARTSLAGEGGLVPPHHLPLHQHLGHQPVSPGMHAGIMLHTAAQQHAQMGDCLSPAGLPAGHGAGGQAAPAAHTMQLAHNLHSSPTCDYSSRNTTCDYSNQQHAAFAHMMAQPRGPRDCDDVIAKLPDTL